MADESRTALLLSAPHPARPELTRSIRWEPHVGRMRLRFLLAGERGTVQFLWNIRTKGERNGYRELADVPEGWDLGFHAAEPRDYQDEDDKRDCDVLTQGFCWYDGSGLQGEELGNRFVESGEEIVWETLQDRYEYWLEGRDDE